MKPDVSYYYPALETMSRDEVLKLQWTKLKRELEYLYHNNVFYKRKFKEANLTPDDIKTMKDFKKFPLSTKDDFMKDQQENPPFGNRCGVPEEKIAQLTITANTSGMGQEVHALTSWDLKNTAALAALPFYWGGLRQGDTGVVNVGLGNHLGGWCYFEGVRAVAGRTPYFVNDVGFEERLELMQRFGVHGIWATPSALNSLTILCRQKGIDPKKAFPNLKFILTAAEPYPLPWVIRIQDIWGVKLLEQYGSTQAMGICMSCCENGAVVNGQPGGMHLFEWNFVCEIVDPASGENVGPGESGELILTGLDREGPPIIRFSTRDMVTYLPHTQCDCGRALDMVQCGSIGRLDDMMKVKVTNVWPNQFDSVIFSYPEIDEYQGRLFINKKGRDDVEISVAFTEEYDRRLSPDEKEEMLKKIVRHIKSNTELTVRIKQVQSDELPHFITPESKARRWTDERQADLSKQLT
jgi:phenylacetate-CoA ligase